MKRTLASLIAVPLLSLSSMAFAAETDAHEPMLREPLLLSAAQMDEVTAGNRQATGGGYLSSPGFWRSFPSVYKRAEINQINISPVVIIQIGNNNTAVVYSGNFASIHQ